MRTARYCAMDVVEALVAVALALLPWESVFFSQLGVQE